MATVGGFSRHHHLDELNSPLETAEGVMSPAERKMEALANLTLLPEEAAITGAAEVIDGMTVEHHFDGAVHRTRFTFDDVDIGTQGDNANLASGTKIFTFPASLPITVLQSALSGTLLGTGSVLTDTPEVGLGTTLASGAQATLGAVAATAEDLCGPFVAASINNGAVGGLNAASGIKKIAAGGTKTVHFNIADGWADVTAAADVKFTGFVELVWVAQ